MQVDTGAFRALTDTMEQLAGKVDALTARLDARSAVDKVVYEAGWADGQKAILGRPVAGLRPRRHHESTGHLRPVDGGAK